MAGLIQASKVEAEEVDWIWPPPKQDVDDYEGLIPRGMMTIIGGRPDQGKGLGASHIAADVSQMKFPKPGGGLRFGQVLYSAMEDSPGLMTRPRLEAAGANLKNIHLWRFMLPLMLDELEVHIVKKDIDLVVIDPFAAHLSHGVSRHSDSIRELLNPLGEMLENTNTAMIIIEHVLKRVPANSHPLAAIGGSGSGVVAASRMAYLLGVDPSDEDRRVLAPVKHNICEKPKAVAFEVDAVDIELKNKSTIVVPYLLFDGQLDGFDPMVLVQSTTSGKVGRPPDKRANAAEWLTNYLYEAGKPVKAGLVMEDAKQQGGMSVKTLRRAAHDMGVLRNPPGGGKNCTWELPDEILDLLNASAVPEDDDMKVDVVDMTAFEDVLKGSAPVDADKVDKEADDAADDS